MRTQAKGSVHVKKGSENTSERQYLYGRQVAACKQCGGRAAHHEQPDGLLELACVVQNANMGHRLAGGDSSWCPELEAWTTPVGRPSPGPQIFAILLPASCCSSATLAPGGRAIRGD